MIFINIYLLNHYNVNRGRIVFTKSETKTEAPTEKPTEKIAIDSLFIQARESEANELLEVANEKYKAALAYLFKDKGKDHSTLIKEITAKIKAINIKLAIANEEKEQIKNIMESIKHTISETKKKGEEKTTICDSSIEEAATLIVKAKLAIEHQQETKALDFSTRAIKLCEPYPLFEALHIRSFINIKQTGNVKVYEQILIDADKICRLDENSPNSYFYKCIANHRMGKFEIASTEFKRGVTQELALFDTDKKPALSSLQELAFSAFIECEHQLYLKDYNPLKDVNYHKKSPKEAHTDATRFALNKAQKYYENAANNTKLIGQALQFLNKAILIDAYLSRKDETSLISVDFTFYYNKSICYREINQYTQAIEYNDIALWICRHRLMYLSGQNLDDYRTRAAVLNSFIEEYQTAKEGHKKEAEELAQKLRDKEKEQQHKKELEIERKKETEEKQKMAGEHRAKSGEEKKKNAPKKTITSDAERIEIELQQAAQAKKSMEQKQKAQEQRNLKNAIAKKEKSRKAKELARTKFKKAIYKVLTASTIMDHFSEQAEINRASEMLRCAQEKKERDESQIKALKQKSKKLKEIDERRTKAIEHKYQYLRIQEQIKKSQLTYKKMLTEIKSRLAIIKESEILRHIKSQDLKSRTQAFNKFKKSHLVINIKENLKLYNEEKKQEAKEKEKKERAIAKIRQRNEEFKLTLSSEQTKLLTLLNLATVVSSKSAYDYDKKEFKETKALACKNPEVLPNKYLVPSHDNINETLFIPYNKSNEKILKEIQAELALLEIAGSAFSFAVGGIARAPLMNRSIVKFKKGGSQFIDVDIVIDGGRKEIEIVYPKDKGFTIVETSMPGNNGTLYTVYQNSKSDIRIHRQIFQSPYFGKEECHEAYKFKYADPLYTDALSRDQLKNAVYFDRYGRVYMPLKKATYNALLNKIIAIIDPRPLKELKRQSFNETIPPELLSFDEDPKRLLRVLIDHAEHPGDPFMVENIPEGLSLLLNNSKGKPRSDSEISSLNVCLFDKMFSSPHVIQIFKILSNHRVIDTLFPGLRSSIARLNLSKKLTELYLDPSLRLEDIYAGMIILQHYEYFNSLTTDQIKNDDILLTEIAKLIKTNPLYKSCFNSFHNRTINYIQRRTDEIINGDVTGELKAPSSLCDIFRKSIDRFTLLLTDLKDIPDKIDQPTRFKGALYIPRTKPILSIAPALPSRGGIFDTRQGVERGHLPIKSSTEYKVTARV